MAKQAGRISAGRRYLGLKFGRNPLESGSSATTT